MSVHPHHPHTSFASFKIRREVLLVCALLAGAFLVSAVSQHLQKPFASSEVQFTDSSKSGLAIVPASCPSEPSGSYEGWPTAFPHSEGDCSIPPKPPKDTCVIIADPSSVPDGPAAQSSTYSTSGTYTFTVPDYTGSLVIEAWGGGGGGGGDGGNDSVGGNGGQSKFENLKAEGGIGGKDDDGGSGGTGGAGGTASGGDTNTSGGAGGNAFAGASGSGTGGNAAGSGGGGGGAGVSLGTAGNAGVAPGGGGSGGAYDASVFGGGGGAGGYMKKTYASGQLNPGSSKSIKVGSGGSAGSANSSGRKGGAGASGRVRISWEEDPKVILAWNSNNSKNPRIITPSVGSVGASGATVVYPTETTTYTFTAGIQGGGTMSCSTTVTVGDECPTGYTLQDGQCVPATCPMGYEFQNGQCVFVACPTGYDFQDGQCVSSQCSNSCINNNLVNSCTGPLVPSCTYGCSDGGAACNPIPAPSIVTWNVRPTLVNSGTAVQVTWAAQNVTSCNVTGTNSDAWSCSGNSCSTETTRTTSPITAQTIYTIVCQGFTGSSPSSVTLSTTVYINPVFNEP